jgi:SAM-dependent methyltransferase
MPDEKPWYDDDQLWAALEPVMFGKDTVAEAPDEVDKIISLLNLEPGMNILDLCCGIGRHALELARRGYKVTGVDRTKVYLDKAIAAAREENLNIEFIRNDMRDFIRPESFDTVLSMFTSFGYFEDDRDDLKVLTNVLDSLKPGGRFIMHTKGKEVLARVFLPRDWSERDDHLVLYERELSDDWSMMNLTITLIKNNQRKKLHLRHRLFSAAELKSKASEAGFQNIKAYGSLDGAPYDNNADFLVFVAEK